MLKFRVTHKLVGSTVLEYLRMLNAGADFSSHALKLFVIIWLSQEVLTGINELIPDCIRFESSFKQIFGSPCRIVENRFYLSAFRSLTSYYLSLCLFLLGLI